LLIRETEELRGNRIRDEPADEDQVTSSEGSAAAVISRHPPRHVPWCWGASTEKSNVADHPPWSNRKTRRC
jgi:hypothetical protein